MSCLSVWLQTVLEEGGVLCRWQLASCVKAETNGWGPVWCMAFLCVYICESEALAFVRVALGVMESHILLLLWVKGQGNNIRQEHLCISDATLNEVAGDYQEKLKVFDSENVFIRGENTKWNSTIFFSDIE